MATPEPFDPKATPPQLPTICRLVHYQAYGTPGGEYPSVPRAAIITQVHDFNTVGLCVINPTGLFFHERVAFGGPDKPGTWSWPPVIKQGPAPEGELGAEVLGQALGRAGEPIALKP